MRRYFLALAALALAATALLSACNGSGGAKGGAIGGNGAALPQGDEPYDLDPANFVAEIDNPFWPLTPGNRWVYTETDAEGNEMQVEVIVTSDKKDIGGISATVVRDVVTDAETGDVIEDTFDWYAQDVDGNIWYLGEDTKEYENGEVVSTAGSWEAGVDGALAGVVMPADPQVGLAYRQEYYAGEAEDSGKILSLDEHVEVPFGTFDGCLQTEDTTALEPDVLEHKYYCRDVGPTLVVDIGAGGGGEELVTFQQGVE
jgi:predicted small secreted protein